MKVGDGKVVVKLPLRIPGHVLVGESPRKTKAMLDGYEEEISTPDVLLYHHEAPGKLIDDVKVWQDQGNRRGYRSRLACAWQR